MTTDYSYVGLEISSASIQRALRRVKAQGLTNVRLLKVGAAFAVRHLFAPRSLYTTTLNFPDPWPKERHEENRLLREPFFKLAASCLRKGGRILLATDHDIYLASALAEAERSGLYTLEGNEPPAAVFATKYALKWKSEGKPLYYQVFAYRGEGAPAYPGLTRDEIMPHAFLHGRLPERIDFAKQVTPYASGYVILHDVARVIGPDREGGERWLVRVTVDEPALKQQVLVSVRSRDKERVIVQLEPFGDPIITETARGAVHAVVAWLLTLPVELGFARRAY